MSNSNLEDEKAPPLAPFPRARLGDMEFIPAPGEGKWHTPGGFIMSTEMLAEYAAYRKEPLVIIMHMADGYKLILEKEIKP